MELALYSEECSDHTLIQSYFLRATSKCSDTPPPQIGSNAQIKPIKVKQNATTTDYTSDRNDMKTAIYIACVIKWVLQCTTQV